MFFFSFLLCDKMISMMRRKKEKSVSSWLNRGVSSLGLSHPVWTHTTELPSEGSSGPGVSRGSVWSGSQGVPCCADG